jgi:hypothetical protein
MLRTRLRHLLHHGFFPSNLPSLKKRGEGRFRRIVVEKIPLFAPFWQRRMPLVLFRKNFDSTVVVIFYLAALVLTIDDSETKNRTIT